jgi:hypothetical protein
MNLINKIKIHFVLWAVLTLFFAPNTLTAQVSGYVFSETAGTYSAITGTTIHAAGWTDPAPVSVPIPFTFTFNSVAYNSCSVNGNGYITFGATASLANGYQPISGTTAYAGAISAMGIDLVSNASTIEYATTGIAPNRVFIVQWNNCRRSLNNVAGADWNFQIRLLETSNIIRVVYGACAATNATNTVTSQIGLRGANNSDWNARYLNSAASWANSTNSNIINSQTVLSRNTALPPAGRTFIWTPALFTNSCDPNGNLIIYSNYDGGVLNINVDQNIPNLKIGICSYEGVTVNIAGAFVGNVTAVRYAGYNGSNAHCSITPINTTINGVAPAITSINIYPPSTIIVPNGSANIVCAYQCNLGNNGGCNTTGQVAHYFLTHLGGTLRYQTAQYGCWTGTQLVSGGGNCCLVAQALPVELSYFSAHCTTNNEAVLEWETASEINNHYFTLERSTDGIVFENIATVLGAGTSSQPNTYRYVDAEALSETSYYRLRQTDYNGQSETFPVRVLERSSCTGSSAQIAGFPNPAKDRFVVQVSVKEAGELHFYWSDIHGKIIRIERVWAVKGWNSFAFDVAELPAGSYTLHIDGSIPLEQNHLLLIKE